MARKRTALSRKPIISDLVSMVFIMPDGIITELISKFESKKAPFNGLDADDEGCWLGQLGRNQK
jgi:hypothetical protein